MQNLKHFALLAGVIFYHSPLSLGCESFSASYAPKLIEKITSGIPFEIAAIVTQNEIIKAQANVHVSYDLWDETISLTHDRKTVVETSIGSVNHKLCALLSLQILAKNIKTPYLYTVIFNPFWKERMSKLQKKAASNSENMFTLNWSDFSAKLKKTQIMYSEKVEK